MTTRHVNTDSPPGAEGTISGGVSTWCKIFGHRIRCSSLGDGGPCIRKHCSYVEPAIAWDNGVPMPPVKTPREADHEQKLLIQSDKVINRQEQTIAELTGDVNHLLELLTWAYVNCPMDETDEMTRKIKAIIGAPT